MGQKVAGNSSPMAARSVTTHQIKTAN